MSDSLQPHGLQHTRPPCPSPTPRACSNSCPWSSDAIQLSHPLSSPSPPAFNFHQHQGLLQGVSSSHQVATVLEIQLSISLPINLLLFSCSVVSNSLQPHELQHNRPPCPSPTPGVYSTHIHWVGDTIQPSHPLSSPSPPASNLSQHQGLFKWVSSSHQVATVLEFQLQHQSFQWIFRTDLL